MAAGAMELIQMMEVMKLMNAGQDACRRIQSQSLRLLARQ
jgi:hypothetical protein